MLIITIFSREFLFAKTLLLSRKCNVDRIFTAAAGAKHLMHVYTPKNQPADENLPQHPPAPTQPPTQPFIVLLCCLLALSFSLRRRRVRLKQKQGRQPTKVANEHKIDFKAEAAVIVNRQPPQLQAPHSFGRAAPSAHSDGWIWQRKHLLRERVTSRILLISSTSSGPISNNASERANHAARATQM